VKVDRTVFIGKKAAGVNAEAELEELTSLSWRRLPAVVCIKCVK
jgi:hypothetical protein